MKPKKEMRVERKKTKLFQQTVVEIENCGIKVVRKNERCPKNKSDRQRK